MTSPAAVPSTTFAVEKKGFDTTEAEVSVSTSPKVGTK